MTKKLTNIILAALITVTTGCASLGDRINGACGPAKQYKQFNTITSMHTSRDRALYRLYAAGFKIKEDECKSEYIYIRRPEDKGLVDIELLDDYRKIKVRGFFNETVNINDQAGLYRIYRNQLK